MKELRTPFVRQVDETVFFRDIYGGAEFVFIVPEFYFEGKAAQQEGDFINLMGTIDYAIFKDGEPRDYLKHMKTFNFPSMFYTKPGRMEKVKRLKLRGNSAQDYRMLIYRDNDSDEIIHSTMSVQDLDNAELLNDIFVKGGHINTNISYYDLYKYLTESLIVNGANYNISYQIVTLPLSELCRDPNDITKPFRLSSAPDKDPYSYTPISIKEAPKYVSAFQAITSENWDEGLMAAIMADDGGPRSPLEKVMTN